jgi:hypothetical protein
MKHDAPEFVVDVGDQVPHTGHPLPLQFHHRRVLMLKAGLHLAALGPGHVQLLLVLHDVRDGFLGDLLHLLQLSLALLHHRITIFIYAFNKDKADDYALITGQDYGKTIWGLRANTIPIFVRRTILILQVLAILTMISQRKIILKRNGQTILKTQPKTVLTKGRTILI